MMKSDMNAEVNEMFVIFSTQVHENYGDQHSDYWKPKGGNEYILTKTDGSLTNDQISELLTQNTPMYRENVLDYRDVFPDFVPEFEKSQQGWEGVIRHYEPRITVRNGQLFHWKKVFGYDNKEYIWAYNLSENDHPCVFKNDNAKTLN